MGLRGLAANPRLSRPGARRLNPANVFDALRLADIHQNLARNIVSIRQSQDLFDDLSPDPQDWNIAIRHELATQPRPYTSDRPHINRPFEEAVWIEAVAYPFQPPNWSKSRFSDGSFGIWYGADAIETTLYETVWHWRNGLLADAGFEREGVRIERKVYWVRGDAALVDFGPELKRMPGLIHPTKLRCHPAHRQTAASGRVSGPGVTIGALRRPHVRHPQSGRAIEPGPGLLAELSSRSRPCCSRKRNGRGLVDDLIHSPVSSAFKLRFKSLTVCGFSRSRGTPRAHTQGRAPYKNRASWDRCRRDALPLRA